MTLIIPPPVDKAIMSWLRRRVRMVSIGVRVRVVGTRFSIVIVVPCSRSTVGEVAGGRRRPPNRGARVQSHVGALALMRRGQGALGVVRLIATEVGVPPSRSNNRRPIRTDAAECELDGPRMTGPMTSLKMLASRAMAFG